MRLIRQICSALDRKEEDPNGALDKPASRERVIE